MSVSISFQLLDALQNLERLREATPQFPRLVKPLTRVRRHTCYTASSDRTTSSVCTSSSNCDAHLMPNAAKPDIRYGSTPRLATGSSMRSKQARISLSRALSVLRMPSIPAVPSGLRTTSRRKFPTRRQIVPNLSEKSTKNFFRIYILVSRLSGNCWRVAHFSPHRPRTPVESWPSTQKDSAGVRCAVSGERSSSTRTAIARS